MKCYALICLVLLLTVHEQNNKLPIEELFAYFPEGDYSAISHYDLTIINDKEKLTILQKYVPKEIIGIKRSLPIPDHLKSFATHVTIGSLTNYIDKEADADHENAVKEKTEDVTNRLDPIYIKYKDDANMLVRKRLFEYNQRVYSIILYPDIQEIKNISDYFNNSVIYKSFSNNLNRPIYDYKHRGKIYYASILPTFEMLVTEDKSLLTKMVRVYWGLEASLADQDLIKDIEDFYPELGYYWICNTNSRELAHLKMAIEMRAPPSYLDEIQARIDNTEKYFVLTSLITNTFVEKNIYTYHSEEVASNNYGVKLRNRLKSLERASYNPIVRSFALNDYNITKMKLKDDMIITTKNWNEEYLKTKNAWFESIEKKKEE